ncbi:MAG TPA: hypothetical protein DIU08_04735 [Ktedonobacter sp.]|jgi:hypothetical protein|nr:hypothetical protein [Ktedonobacter sp.]
MTPHPYLYEKLIATHQAQIRHDIQQSRMAAHAGRQRTLMQSTVGKFGTLLIELGSHLQRTGQRSGAPIHSS